MQTWRDFKESLAASQPGVAVPPFRPADLATGWTPGINSDQSSFSVGADRLDFLQSRLQFGSSSWPLPPAPPLRDVPLTIHLGDLYERPNHPVQEVASSSVAAEANSEAPTHASVPGAPQLRAAVRAWLLARPDQEDDAASRDLARCSERATPEDWLQILQVIVGSDGFELSREEPNPAASARRGCSKTCPSANVGEALCRLMAVCPGLGDCILSHALPFLLASSWCEKTGHALVLDAGSTDGLNTILEKLLSQVRTRSDLAWHFRVHSISAANAFQSLMPTLMFAFSVGLLHEFMEYVWPSRGAGTPCPAWPQRKPATACMRSRSIVDGAKRGRSIARLNAMLNGDR